MSDVVAKFARDGWAVLPERVPEADCDALMARARAWVEQLAASTVATFSTDQRSHESDESFLASAAGVSLFWEEDAAGSSVPNKLGHAMHDLDPVFDAFARQPLVQEAARAAGLGTPRLVQSMLIFKDPGVGGAVGTHQDGAFLRTDPGTVVGVWVALADADAANGGLEVCTGAHRGPLRRRYLREGDALRFEVDSTVPYPEEGWEHVEVPKGSVVLLHGLLPHRSSRNASSRPRPAFTLHLVDGDAAWLEDNWIRRPDSLPFRGFEPA